MATTATTASASLPLGPRRCRALLGLPASQTPTSSAVAPGSPRSPRSDGQDEDYEGGGDEIPPSAHGFMVGTTVLGGENDLITLQFSEEDKRLSQMETKPHAFGEVWELSTNNDGLLLSCFGSASEGRGIAVHENNNSGVKVPGSESARVAVFEKKSSRFASVHEDGLVKFWNFSQGTGIPQVDFMIKSSEHVKGTKDLAWDPTNPEVLIAACGGNFARVFDARERREVAKIDALTRCLTVDANPNRPHFFLTAGEDGQVKFWDSRKTNETVLTLKEGHAHWVTKARYNPFHDQLVISSSTDGVVCLWRATSVSSAPLLDMDSDEEEDSKQETKKQQQDALVKTFDDNLDSVYGLSWSAVNAWVYASLSYDGRVVIHTVPSGEKYKILL